MTGELMVSDEVQGAALRSLAGEIQALSPMVERRPRQEDKILERALAELKQYPQFARKAYYSIPYKEKRGDPNAGTVWVQGLTIESAMALARFWGNCLTAGKIIEETKDYVQVQGVFVDLQAGRIEALPYRISRLAWSRSGQNFTAMDDRKMNMAIMAGVSKAIRNATLKCLPVALRETYINEARIIGGGKQEGVKITTRSKELLAAFKDEFQVSRDQIIEYIGKDKANWTDIENLQGLLSALREGTVTAAEVFGGPLAAPLTAPGGGGAVSVDSVLQGQDQPPAPAQAEPEKKPEAKIDSPFKDGK